MLQPFGIDTYNFPCLEDPYNNYRSLALNYPFKTVYENDNSCRYQSYEVYRHHNSETFYFESNENVCPVMNDEAWNGLKVKFNFLIF